ncbi:histone deacetylase complex subunit SAP30 homolog [Tetranychus urticae]|uniref:Histone deacetylase complex subunit SAP30 Sin3 binding domain-containing protein n=1 Tax=Tetranychus urticae TaxID=32264 RepID=T1KWN1_TETUR|nr:histone deacetylase complex subunit SAP30 homolog [Tetranychus urticae]
MESHGMYDAHNKMDDIRDNKLASFASPGSAFSSSFSLSSNSHQLCCLTEDGSRCNRVAGNASYSKRIQKTVQQKKLRLSIDNTARHVYICDHHKNMIQSVRSCVKRKRKDSCEDENGTNSNDCYSFADRNNPLSSAISGPSNGSTPIRGMNTNNLGNSGSGKNDLPSSANSEELPQVDLSTLQINTLRRYKRHYRIQTSPGINKSQLAEVLLDHFKTIPIDEKEALTYFIYMVKCNRNKVDQLKGLTTSNSSLPYPSSMSDHNNT